MGRILGGRTYQTSQTSRADQTSRAVRWASRTNQVSRGSGARGRRHSGPHHSRCRRSSRPPRNASRSPLQKPRISPVPPGLVAPPASRVPAGRRVPITMPTPTTRSLAVRGDWAAGWEGMSRRTPLPPLVRPNNLRPSLMRRWYRLRGRRKLSPHPWCCLPPMPGCRSRRSPDCCGPLPGPAVIGPKNTSLNTRRKTPT